MASTLPDRVADVAVLAAPWVAGYTALYFASLLLGPLLFAHCHALDEPGRAFWASSICSTVNGVLLTALALNLCITEGWHHSADFRRTSPGSHMLCHAMLGYALTDVAVLLYYWKAWKPSSLVVHHAIVIGAWGACATEGILHNCAVPVSLSEGTALFANLRWFLSTAGLKQTLLYKLNGCAILVLWFVLRVYLLGWIGWHRLGPAQRPAFLALGQPTVGIFLTFYLASYTQQLYWFNKIFQGLLNILRDKDVGYEAAAGAELTIEQEEEKKRGKKAD